MVHAQRDSIAGYVMLDSLVIHAQTDEFDVNDFIRQVKEDTSYVKAFKNLRYYPHQSEGKITVFSRSAKEKGMMERSASHFLKKGLHWVHIDSETTNGKIKNKKGEYRYYTAELFDAAFYPPDTFYANNAVGSYGQAREHDSKKQKHKNDIKMMMFNPGAAISDIPIVGEKMAIFDDHMVPYYDYKIWQFDYRDSIPCYAFTCKAKPEFRSDKTVIKDLTSYFNMETMEVMKREYHVMYKSALFEFDVHINVDLEKVGTALVPVKINYAGFWDVPLQKAEYVNFVLHTFHWKVPS